MVVPVTISVVENTLGELLLLKRAASAQLGPGLWGFPGGRANPGEGYMECGRRELVEELGSSHDAELIAAAGPFRDTQCNGQFEIHLLHFRWHRGVVVLSAEHVDYAWVGRDRYRDFDVVPGTDEDIAYLRIWPIAVLNQSRLPKHLK